MKTQELRIEEALAPTVFTHVQNAADELSLETYVIGGYVRDTFLDRQRGHDIDILTVGSGISLAKKVAGYCLEKTTSKFLRTTALQ